MSEVLAKVKVSGYGDIVVTKEDMHQHIKSLVMTSLLNEQAVEDVEVALLLRRTLISQMCLMGMFGDDIAEQAVEFTAKVAPALEEKIKKLRESGELDW